MSDGRADDADGAAPEREGGDRKRGDELGGGGSAFETGRSGEVGGARCGAGVADDGGGEGEAADWEPAVELDADADADWPGSAARARPRATATRSISASSSGEMSSNLCERRESSEGKQVRRVDSIH